MALQRFNLKGDTMVLTKIVDNTYTFLVSRGWIKKHAWIFAVLMIPFLTSVFMTLLLIVYDLILENVVGFQTDVRIGLMMITFTGLLLFIVWIGNIRKWS
jgi:hypothetical protein